MKKSLCPSCLGTGQVPDQACIGATMRELRRQAGLTLRCLARRLRTSYSHLSLLENGKRAWNLGLVEGYRKACAL